MREALTARTLEARVQRRRAVRHAVVPRGLTLGSDRIRAITVDERCFQTVHRPIDGFDVVTATLQLKRRQTHLLRAELLRRDATLVGATRILKESIDLCAVVALREDTNPRKLSHDYSLSCVMERRI